MKVAEEPPLPAPDLARRSVRGVAWSAGSKIGQQVLQFAVMAMLARLVAPEDFGLIAMVVVFSGFAAIFGDLGLGQALIQRGVITEAHRSTAFWLNLLAGACLTGLFIALAPALAALYERPELLPLVTVVAANFTLASTVVVQRALLQRGLRFREIGFAEIGATCVGGGAALAFAASGAGVWALVAHLLVTTATRSAILWVMSEWRPTLVVDRESLRDLWEFSRNVLGFSAINYWSRNADNFIIGRFVGPASLGLYSRAYNTMLMPMRDVSMVLQQVMFPALSRIQADTTRVRRAYLDAIGLIAMVTFPMGLGLLVVAEGFIETVYGQRWLDAAPLLQVLCLAGLPQPLSNTTGWIFKSQGRADIMFRWGLVASAVNVIAFFVGVQWGAIGVAWAYAFATLLLTAPSFVIAGRLIDMTLGDLVHVTYRPLVAAAVMAAAVHAAGAALASSASRPVVLMVQVVTGVAVYSALLCILRVPGLQRARELGRLHLCRTDPTDERRSQSHADVERSGR